MSRRRVSVARPWECVRLGYRCRPIPQTPLRYLRIYQQLDSSKHQWFQLCHKVLWSDFGPLWPVRSLHDPMIFANMSSRLYAPSSQGFHKALVHHMHASYRNLLLPCKHQSHPFYWMSMDTIRRFPFTSYRNTCFTLVCTTLFMWFAHWAPFFLFVFIFRVTWC